MFHLPKLVALLIICVVVSHVRGAADEPYRTIYVESNGNDGNDGSAEKPYRTLLFVAKKVLPGDLVIVRKGNYSGCTVKISGEEKARITFRGEPGAMIDRRDDEGKDGINLEGASYITIEGFKVINQRRAGLRAVENRGIIFRNNECHDNGYWGIFTGFSSHLLVENNKCSGSQKEHGIYVSNSADHPTVRGNVCWNNRGCGVQLNADKSMGGDGIISNAVIEGNTFYSNGKRPDKPDDKPRGAGINLDGVHDSVIANNLLYDNHASGIALFHGDGATGAQNNLVINNTVIMADDARWALNIQGDSTGNKIYNNILLNLRPERGSIEIAPQALVGFVSDNNLIKDKLMIEEDDYDLDEWREQTKQDASTIIAKDPSKLFIDIDKHDYRLAPKSPAINKGRRDDAPAVDRVATKRDESPDIGAIEYRSE